MKALVLVAGVKTKKKGCTMRLDCEASQWLWHRANPHCRSHHTSAWVAANVMNEMMIILTLRQQSVLRGLAFRKPHVPTHTMYCYSVFSFCLFLCVPKLCVIADNYVDSCLVLPGLVIRIGKWYTLTAFQKPLA